MASSSLAATLQQVGSGGARILRRTSVIGRNRKAPSQNIQGGIDEQHFPESMSSINRKARNSSGYTEDVSGLVTRETTTANASDSDSLDGGSSIAEDSFDEFNPLFEHVGGARDQRYGTESFFDLHPESESLLSLKRIFQWLKETFTVQFDGAVSISVLDVSGLKHSGEARIRFSLNGEVAWSDRTDRTLNLPHVKTQKRGVNVNADELVIEINDAETDSFWGTASLTNVDQILTSEPTKTVLPVYDSIHIKVGEITLTLVYHKYDFKQQAELRWRSATEWPKQVFPSAMMKARAYANAIARLLVGGLEGMNGGAASWVVFGALTIPFILATLFTKWSWATRQWLLVTPIYMYLSASLPVINGWLFGTLVTVFAMHGYPGRFRCGALHIIPWIRGWAFHIRVTGIDVAMGNPPGFPLENFLFCKRVDVSGSISFRHAIDFALLRYKKSPLKKVPDFRLLALWNIDYIEIDDCTLDFIMYKGTFNVWEVSHLLAEHEARNIAWAKGFMKSDDPMPNELEIRIIRAKNLVKTRTSKRSLKTQTMASTAASGPLGKNAVFDAFFDDESGAEEEFDDVSEDENSSTIDPGERNGRSSSISPRARRGSSTSPTGRRSSISPRRRTSSTFTDKANDDANKLTEDEKRVIQESEQQRRKYRGLGPPQFNPMDASVKRAPKQGHFDPYVLVSLRRDVQKTKTQTKSNSPMWNETFHFNVTDAATVVHVQVFNREVTQDRLIGQWVMTIKYMLCNPYYCWHEKGLEVTKDRWIRGWFPLMNKNFRGIGRCGKLEMAMQWRYVLPEKLKRKLELPPLSALAQLQENSEESRLRMGDMARIKYWLNHEPFLFLVDRMSVFNFKMYLQDIFLPGMHGEAEKKPVDQLHYVHVPRVDWLKEFRPKHGDPGITLYKMLYVFFAGIAPKVMNTAKSQANVTRTISVIAGAAGPQLRHGIGQTVKSLFQHGGVVGKGLVNLTKGTDRAIQLVHRNVTVNKENEANFKVPVDADDEDFLLDTVTVSGHLARYATKLTPGAKAKFDASADSGFAVDVEMERESLRKGGFRKGYYELKGRTLFYRKTQTIPKGSMYNVSYKIPLDDVIGVIFFVEREELMLNMPNQGIVTRLRLVANEAESGDDDDEQVSTGLEKWFQAFKACGVPCYTWKRDVLLNQKT